MIGTKEMKNEFIYKLSEEGEPGDKVDYLKDGKSFFNSDEN